MIKSLKNFTIVIPLHLPLGYPSDYVDQTAKILSKQNQVIFYEFRFHYHWKKLITKNGLSTYFNSLRKIVFQRKEEVYYRPIPILPFQRIKYIYRLNNYLGLLQFRLILWFLRKKIILWGFDPSIEILIKQLGEKISLYDCIDYYGEDKETSSLKPMEKKLFKKVGCISFNSWGLYEKKVKLYPKIKNKSTVTVCGCAIDLFNKEVKSCPNELTNINMKKIICAGVFDYRINTKLLIDVINKNSDKYFIFIGPIDKTAPEKFKKILTMNNVMYLGKRGKKELVNYYKNADLGIIPYDTKYKFVKFSNPMKAYEYLASGVPVVSTNILALKNYPKDIVFTTDDGELFSHAIKNFIEACNKEKETRAKQIAEQNSWNHKILQIESFILKKRKK